MPTNNAINNTVTNANFTVPNGTVTAGTGLIATTGGVNATGNSVLNGGTVGIGTDNAANAITIGTGTTGRMLNFGRSAAAHTIVMGNTNTTTSVDLASGTGNMILNSAGTNTLTGTGGVTIQSTNTAIGVTSGTGTISISADAAATAVNIGTGAGAKVVTVGSTNGASSLALRYGTADMTMASATGTVMSALDTGEITYPLQPAFLAYQNTSGTDVTGDSTIYTLAIDTEIFDQNGDFDTGTFTFTAPVTGRYRFETSARVQQLGILFVFGQLLVVTSNNTYSVVRENPGAIFETSTGSTTLNMSGAVFADMDTGDTATVTVQISGSTKTIDVVSSSAGIQRTWFSGSLVC